MCYKQQFNQQLKSSCDTFIQGRNKVGGVIEKKLYKTILKREKVSKMCIYSIGIWTIDYKSL